MPTIVQVGTVDLEGANDEITGVTIGADTIVIGTLQQKLTTLQLIACEPVTGGANKFIARLTGTPPGGQTVLLAWMTINP